MGLQLELGGAIAVVTLDRPDALNALNETLLTQLSAAFDTVPQSGARALVITGGGTKAFCAGADVKELAGRDMAAQRAGVEFGQSVFAKLDRLHIPSIAVIHGFAFGGGLELAMACTFRVATPSARMGLPEIRLGLIPGYGGTQRLPRLIGPARATEMILSGRIVDAGEAERIGLVNLIAEEGDPVAIGRDFASRFIGFSLCAGLAARRAVQRSATLTLEEGLQVEADLVTLALRTGDAAEGMAAFIEKRSPEFRDS